MMALLFLAGLALGAFLLRAVLRRRRGNRSAGGPGRADLGAIEHQRES